MTFYNAKATIQNEVITVANNYATNNIKSIMKQKMEGEVDGNALRGTLTNHTLSKAHQTNQKLSIQMISKR